MVPLEVALENTPTFFGNQTHLFVIIPIPVAFLLLFKEGLYEIFQAVLYNMMALSEPAMIQCYTIFQQENFELTKDSH